MILASDFDNTLYFPDGFHEKDLAAIDRFRAAGHLFGLCTGRPLCGLTPFTAPSGLVPDFWITNTGGSLYNKDEQVIFEKTFPKDVVLEAVRPYNVSVSVMADNVMYFDREDAHFREHVVAVHSPADVPAEDISAFNFHFPEGEIEGARQCAADINTRFKGILSAYQNNVHVDVCACGCSKGEGTKRIADYFGVPMNQVAGIGDSWNDLPLLEAAGIAITFDSSPEDVKARAALIVPDLASAVDKLMNL